MAEVSHSPAQNPSERLQQLGTRIQSLELESGPAWDQLLEQQQICTEILAEQVVVNSKFSEFHDLWLESGAADNVATFYVLDEIDETVSSLESSLSEFESKAQTTIQLIKDAVVTFQDKLTRIRDIKESLQGEANLSLDQIVEFETFLGSDFLWVNMAAIPNVTELKEQWDSANLYSEMCNCVDQMNLLIPPSDPSDSPSIATAQASDNSSSPELHT